MSSGQSRRKSEVIGQFDSKMVPVGEVEVLKQDGTFEPLKFLIDTGHEDQMGIQQGLAAQYGLWSSPVFPGNWNPLGIKGTGGTSLTSTSKMEVKWLGRGLRVDVHDLPNHVYSGQVGIGMFEGCRVTFDVVGGGKVRVGPIPAPPWYRRLFGQGSAVPQPHGVVSCSSENCLDVFDHPGLAWTTIEVMDSSGGWHSLHAFVDTGDNGGLGLPSTKPHELGLDCSRTVPVATSSGVVNAGIGKARVRWHGNERCIEFVQSLGNDPPKIGTKLLRDNRVTVDRNRGRTKIWVSPV